MTSISRPHSLTIRSPWDGHAVGEAPVTTSHEVGMALSTAHQAISDTRALSSHSRAVALEHVGDRLRERREEFARVIAQEAGKPISLAFVEVDRAASVFTWAAAEAKRWSGSTERFDTEQWSGSRYGVTRRFATGVVLAITPFNFPLNLIAHKVAPAIAAGAPILIKPAPRTPLTALLLDGILQECDLPDGSVRTVVVGDSEVMGLVKDPRVSVVSFTGSERVGRLLQAAVPHKRVLLELGGNAAAVVAQDWDDHASLQRAAESVATHSMAFAGQSCIAVQRCIVHESLADDFTELLLEAISRLPVGDPLHPETIVGPMIDEAAAQRVATSISVALEAGAERLTPAGLSGSIVAPTVLRGVGRTHSLWADEAFAPTLALATYSRLEDLVEVINEGRFGLQAGVFTHDVQTAFWLHRELELGGLIIGDVPTFRADQMAYGGVKDSGVGREGVASAMDDFTDASVLVFSNVAL